MGLLDGILQSFGAGGRQARQELEAALFKVDGALTMAEVKTTQLSTYSASLSRATELGRLLQASPPGLLALVKNARMDELLKELETFDGLWNRFLKSAREADTALEKWWLTKYPQQRRAMMVTVPGWIVAYTLQGSDDAVLSDLLSPQWSDPSHKAEFKAMAKDFTESRQQLLTEVRAGRTALSKQCQKLRQMRQPAARPTR
jgi:hypothetical protein